MYLASIRATTPTQKNIVEKLFKFLGYSPYSEHTIKDYTVFIVMDNNVYQGGFETVEVKYPFEFNKLDQFIERITAPRSVEVKLDGKYTAVVTKKVVKIGGLVFDIDRIRQIVAASDKLK